MRTLILFLLMASPALADCTDTRYEYKTDYQAMTFKCPVGDDVRESMALARPFTIKSKQDGFSVGQVNIVPDGEGNNVYMIKWSKP